jgi:hypothetical protein
MKIRAMVFLDGVIAGIIGAAIIAIWFLFLDAVIRLPFYTPTVLGEGLFLRAQDLALTEGEQVSLKLRQAQQRAPPPVQRASHSHRRRSKTKSYQLKRRDMS